MQKQTFSHIFFFSDSMYFQYFLFSSSSFFLLLKIEVFTCLFQLADNLAMKIKREKAKKKI